MKLARKDFVFWGAPKVMTPKKLSRADAVGEVGEIDKCCTETCQDHTVALKDINMTVLATTNTRRE